MKKCVSSPSFKKTCPCTKLSLPFFEFFRFLPSREVIKIHSHLIKGEPEICMAYISNWYLCSGCTALSALSNELSLLTIIVHEILSKEEKVIVSPNRTMKDSSQWSPVISKCQIMHIKLILYISIGNVFVHPETKELIN